MNEVLKEEKINIKDIIHVVRGKQVILDYDLGRLFEVETKRINEAVKRNPLKFPKEYCFQLTTEELDVLSLRSQFATLNKNNNLRGKHFKYLPNAFTEYGITMLATILKSEKAIKISINIVNEFVEMRKIILQNDDLYKQLYFIENKLLNHDYDIKDIKETLEQLEEKKLRNEIYFNGQIIERYNKQYKNLKVYIDNTFHDRFIFIDKKELYHIGTSLNHIGEKTFSINIIIEDEIKENLLKRLDTIIF